ncbi:response regulator receiver domain protein [Metarhizium robertsii]|uniref:Signal transduction response regulator, receiver domain protein n=2 Tax=Metarhizium robertsii TaxID=568076 RepID=E9F904_METRA|nr:Signal transduction response regulator, receiver domain protein [Metarhizium robertsii ARSEF 23]EFY95772.1 Signal transduction response regulator, receiver domain protein [Metarhizium robertsii ARSEF 23]EXU96912.1 response regulator receiver domain protein [Metarhizium robertsii]
MAHDIASRIKARLSRRRHSTASSLASSRSGLGEASVSSVPSQTSREASFASHAQRTASQTSDEHSEAIGHGAAAGTEVENGDAEGDRRQHHDKDQDGWAGDERGTNQASGLDSEPPAEGPFFQRFGAGNSGGALGASGKERPAQLEPLAEEALSRQKLEGHPLSHVPKLAPQVSQDPRNIPMGSVDMGQGQAHHDMDASDKDPPRHDHLHGSAWAASRFGPHPDPSTQLSPATAVHLPPPPRSTPSPTSSPLRTSRSSTLAVGDRNSPQRGGAGRIHNHGHNLRLFDIGSSGSGVRVPPAHAGDDLEVDPLQPPQHGRELDQLSFASFPAAASASAASSAASPVSFTSDPQPSRRQSLFASRQTSLIKTLLRSNQPQAATDTEHRHSIDTIMVTRKIWVRRPHASATTITINEDDLVDDVRDMILRKYANSLGRTFDSPDLVIRVHPRDQEKERALGPEEVMARTLDTYYPGGQTIDEALIIDIPRRTPKASPRVPIPPGTATTYYITEDGRPSEAGEGYFPPVVAIPSPHASHVVPATAPNGTVPHSIAVLGTGHIPPIPSPGATSRSRLYRDRPDRPRLNRTHTSSPTLMAGHAPGPQASNTGSHGTQNFDPRLPHSRTHSSSSDHPSGLAMVKTPMTKSPGPEVTPARIATPPPRSSSPRAPSLRPKRSKKSSEHPAAAGTVLNGNVPPINVLIVEDNPINLKLLEAFVKRLKVRWQSAMNGQDAVKKWRMGGFHLVLMDIQLPVMNGLDATREIRRLERINTIGVFTSTPDNATGNSEEDIKDQDRLQNPSLFKSPVIIVALTASSLQSDRHEALAAGCNDFLTKPVNFVWLERKVMEWGCMQALIDFDAWRHWKEELAVQDAEREEAAKKALATKAKSKKNRSSLSTTS